jgi:hypothetical protein
MALGTHRAFKTQKQARAAVRLLLRKAAVDFAHSSELCVTLKGDVLDGAFTPPDFVPSPPD